jgi:hypothetical protein
MSTRHRYHPRRWPGLAARMAHEDDEADDDRFAYGGPVRRRRRRPGPEPEPEQFAVGESNIISVLERGSSK